MAELMHNYSNSSWLNYVSIYTDHFNVVAMNIITQYSFAQKKVHSNTSQVNHYSLITIIKV